MTHATSMPQHINSNALNVVDALQVQPYDDTLIMQPLKLA